MLKYIYRKKALMPVMIKSCKKGKAITRNQWSNSKTVYITSKKKSKKKKMIVHSLTQNS